MIRLGIKSISTAIAGVVLNPIQSKINNQNNLNIFTKLNKLNTIYINNASFLYQKLLFSKNMFNSWGNYWQPKQSSKDIAVPQASKWLSRLFAKGQSSLVNTSVRELSLSGQVEHLEKCSNLDSAQPAKRTQISEFTLAEPLGTAKRSLIKMLYGE